MTSKGALSQKIFQIVLKAQEAAGNDPPPMETSLQLHENFLKSSNFHAVAEKYQRVTILQISGLRLCLVWPLLLVCGH